jgi:tetratricopeptide (TPR) repeat protein
MVAVAALAFGWPTRSGGFIHGDDHHFVLEHVFVNHPSLAHAWRLLTIVHGDLYQPLPMLTFQANYAMAGSDPAGLQPVSPYVFHLTNITLHAINAVLACLLAARLARSKPVGLLTGLMFACHPFALEPVAWINGRMILLATTFSLLLMLICVSRSGRGLPTWSFSAAVCWLLALGSKVMPTVPIAAAISDRCVRGRLLKRDWTIYVVLLVLGASATWFAARSAGLADLAQATQLESATSPAVRVLLAAKYYLENYVWPSRLAPWSPPPKDVPFFSREVAIALAECAACAIALWFAWRRNRTACLGLCLFAVLIAPFLAATTARRMLTADRYMYLPIFGLHLALAAWVVQVAAALRAAPGRGRGSVIVATAWAVVLAAWMLNAWSLAPSWSDSLAQARRVIEVYPDSPDAWAELARANMRMKQPKEALEVIAKARRRWPDEPRLALQAGLALQAEGLLGEAEKELRNAVAGMPRQANARYSHAVVLKALNRTAEAREELTLLANEQPRFLPASLVLARLLREEGELDEAARLYERVIEINPYDRDGLFELALIDMQRHRWADARRRLDAILETDATDQPALLNLGVVLGHLGRPEDALRLYDRLIALDGSIVTARLNRAELLSFLARPAEAEAEYRAALKVLEDSGQASDGGRWKELADEIRDKLREARPRGGKDGELNPAAPTSSHGEETGWRP